MSLSTWKSALDAVETVAIVAACGAVVYTVVTGPASRGIGLPPPRPAQLEDVSGRHWSLTVDSASTLNPKDAKVALVEFSDFQCPYCGRFARETFPTLRTDYVDTGKLQYTFKHFPIAQIHSFATNAAKAAICAGKQSRFWEMHDRLFEGQAQLSDQFLTLGVRQLQLNTEAFEGCLKTAEEELANNEAEARRLGVNSTPTFFLGRITSAGVMSVDLRLAGAYPVETFVDAITQVASTLADR